MLQEDMFLDGHSSAMYLNVLKLKESLGNRLKIAKRRKINVTQCNESNIERIIKLI
jgi:hypothetical protein